jgi:heterodisulfide reductase subunit A
MPSLSYDCIIIGSGPAGLKAGNILSNCGYKTGLLEKEKVPGGKLNTWHELFPHRESARAVLGQILSQNTADIHTSVNIKGITRTTSGFAVTDQNNYEYHAQSLLVATGFTPFNALRKEEYGYGIYKNVITSVDLEEMFSNDRIVDSLGKIPGRMAFIHCVGSRDIKVGNEFCSANCCITGIKQAIELKEKFPRLSVWCLYMDLRLGGRFFEDCYKTAQIKYKVQFIRGRLSETNENPDRTLVLRYEDTLAGRPAKLTVDMVVLLVGMEPDPAIAKLFPEINVHIGSDGFFGKGRIDHSDFGSGDGLFFAGSCTGPKSITQSTDEAADVAFRINEYLKKKVHNQTALLHDRIRV